MVLQDARLNFQAIDFAIQNVDLALGCLLAFVLKDLISTKALLCQFIELAHQPLFLEQKSLDSTIELINQLCLL